MSTPFQNRLVGTVIVAAAVIIFLPDILDGKKESNQTDFDAIPSAPEFTGKIDQKSFPTDALVVKENPIMSDEQASDEQLLLNKDIDDTPVNQPQTQDEKGEAGNQTTKITPAIEKVKLGLQPDKATLNEAWVIQLGSFKNKSNVEVLVAKLKGKGYTVFTKPIQTKQGMLTKVFIGPELNKTALEKKILTLKTLTGVQGKVAPFHPN